MASTVFFVGDAVLMMQTMAERGMLEMVEDGCYRRVKPMVKDVREETTNEHNNNLAKLLLLNCLYGNGEGVTLLPPTCSLFFS